MEERKTITDKKKLSHYFHTTSSSNLLKILEVKKGKLKTKYNKYLDEELVYFYYGHDIAYTYSNDIEAFYFPIILGFKKDSFIKKRYNLYPFDTGGIIARLNKKLNYIKQFKINSIHDMHDEIIKLHGGFSNYLNSKYETEIFDKQYKKIFNEINKGIKDNVIDNRILYFELSSKEDIELNKHLSCIIAPRAYHRPFKKNIKDQALSEMQRIKEKIRHDSIDDYSIELTPVKLASYKDSSFKYLDEIESKNKHIALTLSYIVNTIPYLSGFCSILFTDIENGKMKLFELYTSLLKRDMVKFYPQDYSKSNNTNLAFSENNEIYYNKLNINKVQKTVLYYSENNNYNTNNQKNIEGFFCTYKISNTFIIFGNLPNVLNVIAYLVPSIKDEVGTYQEICETIKDYIFEFYEEPNKSSGLIKLFNEDLKYAEKLWEDKINNAKAFNLNNYMETKYKSLLEDTKIDVVNDCWVLFNRKIIPINSQDLKSDEFKTSLIFRNYFKKKETEFSISQRNESVMERFSIMKSELNNLDYNEND